MTYKEIGKFSIERMAAAVDKVHNRLLRASTALEDAHVEYAVVGGNAVAAWVAKVDESAVRNTQDVDILIRRADLNEAIKALGKQGFIYKHAAGVDLFLDGAEAKARDAIHIVFAGEKVKAEYDEAAPDVAQSERADAFFVVELESLVRMKLTSFRRKDQVHLLDLLGVGLIDASWCARFSIKLSARLQELIDNPDS